ncbi:phosphotriesterase-related protein [Lactobacillus sp. YT155]|uniref:phosphotriesterase family protein n=1 Tax=Lactobacillus sp. YT155 TaxID=3060955 RepID=UPI00265E72EA|nr:phosphotriesterase-related protein [Lactobacillus sp. YT155]MDO1604946.1 phosphotriesterase-related protein [Lactobacillus sp. YT155]
MENIIYSHEHVPIDLSELKYNEDCLLYDEENVTQEFIDLKNKGVTHVINMTNNGMGRNLEYLEKIQKNSGVTILSSTGYYQHNFLPLEVFERSKYQLASMMIRDISEGIKGTSIKASVIGEIATSNGKWTEQEEKVFDAAVIAQRETGVPISTHTSYGTLAIEQAKYFIENKANIEKIVIGHVELDNDLEKILTVLKMGLTVEIDTIGKNNYLPDARRVEMIKKIEEAGYVDQLVLSMDITRKSMLKANGGNGYDYLLTSFVPDLLKAGVSEKFVEKMLVETPRRIFLNEVKK